MDWGIVISLVSTLGGIELIKLLFYRKTYRRKEEAEALGSEVKAFSEYIAKYEERIASRDNKIDELYLQLREAQKEILALMERVDRLELEKDVLALQKCSNKECPLSTIPEKGE